MNDQLRDLLRPWAGSPRWDSAHPADDARFNRAIHSIAKEMGTNIDPAEFREALSFFADGALGGDFEPSERVHSWTNRAMSIFGYLSDIEGHE